MEYRRIEVLKIVREARELTADESSKQLFEKLLANAMTFAIKTNNLGPFSDCLVIEVHSDNAWIMSRKPRARFVATYQLIEYVEVESNHDVLNYSEKDEERWDNIM